MSDVFEGPGWWMASDGKWYAPHLHSDASYRARWVNADVAIAQPSAAPDVLRTPAEPATTISEPVAESSWVPEHHPSTTNGHKPVADVPPQPTTPFVASEHVAERAAALSETGATSRSDTGEAVLRSTPSPAPSTAPAPSPVPAPASVPPTPAAPNVATVAPSIPRTLPVTPLQPTEAVVAEASVAPTMPEPIVAPLEAPAPLPSSEPTAPLGFGAPSSTPVSEILSRLGTDPILGRNGSTNDQETSPTQAQGPTSAVVTPEVHPPSIPEPSAPEVLEPAPEPVIEFEAPHVAAPLPSATPLPVMEAVVPEADVTETPISSEAAIAPVRVGPAAEPEPDVAAMPTIVEPVSADDVATGSRARLEVGTPDRGEERFGLLTPTRSTEQRIKLQEAPVMSTSTDLVPVPQTEIAVYEYGASLHDRLVALVLFLSGVAMIVGTFLVWTVSPAGEATGWDMSDGIGTIIAGVIGSAAAGPIFVGFRHIVPKSLAIIAGLTGMVIVGLRGLEALSDSIVAETTVGFGFWLVLGASIIMLLGGVADQSRFGD